MYEEGDMLKARQRNTDLAGNSDGSGSRLSLNFLRSTHLVTLRSRDSKFYHNMSMHIMVVDKGWVHSGITGTITILYAFTHFPRHYLRYVGMYFPRRNANQMHRK